ncbi:MAG: formate dehydrogenase, partial [Methylovulum sp.]|nr:formate dehydrogenase [Methylovulum sp.]
MSITVYIPCDSGAVSLGANRVATAIAGLAQQRGITIDIIRNGSRGMYWLETLVEVATDTGRIAYGPVQASDVASLFDADFINGGNHPLNLGLTEELAYFKKQQRLTFARVGITDPISLDDYLAHDGYRGLSNALNNTQADIVKAVTDSGLRGRGGAAFPTGIKWNTVLNTPSKQKYIICNADEGDSGTFSDRMIMEGDPLVLIEGMTIAGLAVGATQGYIYLRIEYSHAYEILNAA